MSGHKHDDKHHGASHHNHGHASRPYWQRAHRDWRVWIVAVLMLALMLVYVMSDDLSFRPGPPPNVAPAANPAPAPANQP